jgi:DNA invertase Pin-like site-specific DNA recombinase
MSLNASLGTCQGIRHCNDCGRARPGIEHRTDLGVQLDGAGCEKIFKEKRSGADAGRHELKRCLEYLREGDTLLVTKIGRLARSTSDLYRIISQLSEKGVSFKVVDGPTIDTTSRMKQTSLSKASVYRALAEPPIRASR